jgi:medium-chain acyl-[acyl-carrier-protein] hydrolase
MQPPVIGENNWIARRGGPSDPRLRLFCFPYAGGGPAVFRGWTEELKSAGVEICSARVPARDSRVNEPPLRSISDVVAPFAVAIFDLLDRPYALYGHSLGALLAFETARELRRKGARAPQQIVISASPAPQLPWNEPPMRHLEEDAFLAEIQKRYGDIARPILDDRELLSLLLPGLRADVAMLENYCYSLEPPFDCPVTAYGGILDRTVPQASLDAWREQTRGNFELHMVDGHHFCLPLIQERLIFDLDVGRRGSRIGCNES